MAHELEAVDGLRVERDADLLRLTLERPDQRNAFDGPLLEALQRALRSIDDDVRAVVLAGAGEAFCAGADLGWFAGANDVPLLQREEAQLVSRVFAALDQVPVPVVARVQGAAVGGGVGFTALADVAVASEEATFQLAEVRVGLVPAMVAPYVARRIGPARLREWALTAERIGAMRAEAWGLVSAVVTPQRLDDEVERRLELLRAGEPGALRALKAFLRATDGLDPAQVREEALGVISARLAEPAARARIARFLTGRRDG
jgi:methylglutaconyl-CoA hydratase